MLAAAAHSQRRLPGKGTIMICKKVNYKPAIDLLELTMSKTRMPEPIWNELASEWSSWRAREAVAESLATAFSHTRDVLVFNDFEFVRNDQTYILDHLIVTGRNLYTIDSHSVCATVIVTRDGDWERVMGTEQYAFPAPLPELETSVDALCQMLRRHTGRFMADSSETTWTRLERYLTRRNYVAIAPAADVDGWKLRSYKDVLVPGARIGRRIMDDEERAKPSFTQELFWQVTDEQRKALSRGNLALLKDLLLRQDRGIAPIRRAAKLLSERLPHMPASLKKAIDTVLEETTRHPGSQNVAFDTLVILHYCSHCQSDRLWLKTARTGFSFMCEDCGKRTQLNVQCPKCRAPAELTQTHRTFFVGCDECDYKGLFFVNHGTKYERNAGLEDSYSLLNAYASG